MRAGKKQSRTEKERLRRLFHSEDRVEEDLGYSLVSGSVGVRLNLIALNSKARAPSTANYHFQLAPTILPPRPAHAFCDEGKAAGWARPETTRLESRDTINYKLYSSVQLKMIYGVHFRVVVTKTRDYQCPIVPHGWAFRNTTTSK